MKIILICDRRLSLWLVLASLLFTAANIKAESPFSWEPSVSLTDGLDEPQKLGFCLDIFGFRTSLNCQNPMQAHSCKEAGADTQFEYHSETKALRAVNFDAGCNSITNVPENNNSRACVVASSTGIEEKATLSLAECDKSESQTFTVVTNKISHELHVGTSLCLAVSDTTRQAGQYVARDLYLADCNSTPEELKSWTITPTPTDNTDTSMQLQVNSPMADSSSVELTTPANDTTKEVKPSTTSNNDSSSERKFTAISTIVYIFVFAAVNIVAM